MTTWSFNRSSTNSCDPCRVSHKQLQRTHLYKYCITATSIYDRILHAFSHFLLVNHILTWASERLFVCKFLPHHQKMSSSISDHWHRLSESFMIRYEYFQIHHHNHFHHRTRSCFEVSVVDLRLVCAKGITTEFAPPRESFRIPQMQFSFSQTNLENFHTPTMKKTLSRSFTKFHCDQDNLVRQYSSWVKLELIMFKRSC